MAKCHSAKTAKGVIFIVTDRWRGRRAACAACARAGGRPARARARAARTGRRRCPPASTCAPSDNTIGSFVSGKKN